jgi:hypothetical protein
VTDVIVEQGSTNVVVGPDKTTLVRTAVAATRVVQRDGANLAAVVPVQPIALRVGAADQVTRTLNVGTPGPAGPPGPSGSNATQRMAAAALGGHRLVRVLADGSVDYVDSLNPLHGDDTLGVTTGAAEAGALATVQTSGALTEPSWAWMPGEPVFAGTNGSLTQAPPAAGFVQVVGFAATSTSLVIALQGPLYFED